jgi:hypothetical protein
MRALLAVILLAGCFNTKIITSRPGDGTVRKGRQWFTIGGLVALSSPAGEDCGPRGLSRAESRLDVIDVLISIGASLAGGLVGVALCPLEDNPTDDEARRYSACVSGAATLTGFLIQARTVEYQCAAAGTP